MFHTARCAGHGLSPRSPIRTSDLFGTPRTCYEEACLPPPASADPPPTTPSIVGGGHNGLVAAAYLARAGRSVLVLERLDRTGGAAVSTRPFTGVDARLSRYSYLVSLLPQQIVDDLGLRFAVRKRSRLLVHAHRARRAADGLFVGGGTARTRESFAQLTGGEREFEAWQKLLRR